MLIFDETLRPQDNFFGYVNNNWLKNNPIPPNESTWGTFYELRDESAEAIRSIIDELSNTPESNLSYDQKLLKKFFSTAFNYSNYEDNHLKTLSDELELIRGIKDKSQLASYIGHAHKNDFSSFWQDYVSLDDKNSAVQVLRIHQAGLCLPNRDYYLDDSDRMKHVREKYKTFFYATQKLIPKHSPKVWDTIYDIEFRLAKASWTDIELRDVEKNYTRFTIKQLKARFPRFDWLEYFKGLGWEKPNDNVVVDQPSFIDAVLDIITEYTLDNIKEYLSWHLVNGLLSWVNEASAKVYFEFHGKVISGKQENNPTWKRAVLLADRLIIGEVLGREYASRHFPESSKKAVIELVEDIRAAYHRRIDKVTWMKDSTRKRAHRKLDNIRILIGYPSIWRDLSQLRFSSRNHLKNILATHSFASDLELKKIGHKPSREDWHMNAHTVNAYHDPNQLVICFPAAILQPPFYDSEASYASNIGGIGAVIGHEFTHGFDDQGAQFDEQGNAVQWQTDAERKTFANIANNMVELADSYEVLPGIFLRGKLILGEALADIGGLELAVEALKTKINPKGLNNALREMFVSAAISERGAEREEHLIRQVKTDPHPPSRFRVNQVVSQINDFYDTYDVKSSDELYIPIEKRARIW